jgi:spore germination protein GerM
MNRIRHISFAVFVAVFGITIFMLFMRMPGKLTAEEKNTRSKQQSSKSVVHLYFSDRENAEERALIYSDNPAAFGKTIVEALMEGPRKGLVRTIPEQTTLRALFVAQDGTAYVDLSETIKDTFPGGIKVELFAIFSIVNSLILNIPEIDSVKILVGGNEAMTLAGHVELRFPFNANMLLIR